MYRAIFSIMTMASSTTKPVEMVSAIRERLFRLNPSRYMAPKVPTRDRGTATLGMIVAARLRRKRKMTSTTRATASISSNCTSLTEARMVVVRSVSTETLTAGGRELCKLRQQFLDPVDDLDDVGPRLPLDVDDHRRGVVHPGRLLHIFGIVDGLGHIGQPARAPRCDRRRSAADIPRSKRADRWRR